MSLFKRGNTWHFVLRWNGQRYRGSCKTSRRTEAKKVEALALARLLEDGRLPWNRKVPILADFSNLFFTWLESLPADRPPKPPTRRYYQVGWQLLESTSIARMKLDHITADHALTIEGSSAANTNNALRTLRRMLKKAQEWQLLSTLPIVKLVEEQGREELIEPWMEQRLLTVAGGPRLTGKGRNSRTGWEPFRTVLLIMLDSGLRPGEIFRMRWESIHWDKGLIFNPRGKSRKSRRYVPLTERVKAALMAQRGRERRMGLSLEASPVRLHHWPRGFKAMARSQAVGGHSRICRSVLCSPSLLNRCDGRHRQRDGGDGCDGASVNEYRTHLQPLQREADHGSNRAAEPVVRRACGSCAKAGHKSGHSRLKQPCQEML